MKFVLGAVAAMIIFPLGALMTYWDHLDYIQDQGEATLTAGDLLEGKRPSSKNLTITQGYIDRSAGVEYILEEDHKEVGRWYYTALRPVKNPQGEATVLVVSEKRSLPANQTTFSGLWTNADTGINPEVVKLFDEQGIKFMPKALVLDIDATKETKLRELIFAIGGSFALPLVVLILGLIFLSAPVQNLVESLGSAGEKRLEAARKETKTEQKQARKAIRAAIQPYLAQYASSSVSMVQVRASTIGGGAPRIVLAVDDDEKAAPPELAQPMAAFLAMLKKRRVVPTFVTYTTHKREEDDDGNAVLSWHDDFSFS